MKLKHLLPLIPLVLFGACSDEGPVSGPGVMTATLVSPNGAEGAALISLLGEGVSDVAALGDTEAHAYTDAAATQVVLINQVGGELSFRFAVTDTLELPEWVVREVAGPDDALRSSTSAYELQIVP